MNRMKQRLLTFMISAALVIGIFPAIPAIADTDDNTSSEESMDHLSSGFRSFGRRSECTGSHVCLQPFRRKTMLQQ